MTRTYADLVPTFADRRDWTLARVLRTRAAQRPDATFLVTPEDGREWTYSEILAEAETVAGTLAAVGAVAATACS